MLDLFSNTKFRYAEEDRLTNALMVVLQDCQKTLLKEFVYLVTGEEYAVSDLNDAYFTVQVQYERSRPDARIRLRNFDIVIETKRGSELDDDQFERHWSHIQKIKRKTYLVGLTSSHVMPKIVRRM